MTEQSPEKHHDAIKSWGPIDKILRALAGDNYVENLRGISQGYVGAKLEEFKFENIPDKGTSAEAIRVSTINIQAIIKEADYNPDKPITKWGEIFLETIHATLPPYIVMLEGYRGEGYGTISWSARQLNMIYEQAVFDLQPHKSWRKAPVAVDYQGIAERVSSLIKPHFKAIAMEITRYGK